MAYVDRARRWLANNYAGVDMLTPEQVTEAAALLSAAYDAGMAAGRAKLPELKKAMAHDKACEERWKAFAREHLLTGRMWPRPPKFKTEPKS
jgi:hypothetical protein